MVIALPASASANSITAFVFVVCLFLSLLHLYTNAFLVFLFVVSLNCYGLGIFFLYAAEPQLAFII